MVKKIRVLIVEDSADDAELILRELRRAGYDLDWHRVDTEAEYLDHLNPDLDIILSDYSLPQFDGMRAIELLRERGLEIPFILISGTIGEDVAVDAMKKGAADYLLKDRLARLGPAVRHELEQGRLRRERKKADEDLRLFRALVDQSDDCFEVVDPETARFIDVNEKGRMELGYSRDEYLSLRVFDVDPYVAEPDWPQVMEQIRRTGFLTREGLHRRKDGNTFPVELNAKWVRLDRDYIVAVVRDISKRKRAEDRLRKLSSAVEQSPVSIIITDRAGNIEYVNPRFEAMTGYKAEEVIGTNPRILKSGKLPPETYKSLWQTIITGGEWRGEFQNRKKNGELYWAQASISGIKDAGGKITHFLGLKEDITERKKLEAQVLRSQRMDSIGALAGGVAHDLNNILAPILMCAPLLRAGLPTERLEPIIATIEKSAQRGSELVKQVLTFSRGSEGARSPVAVSRLIDDMANVSNQTFPKSIRVEASHASGLWKVTADATQLHQVLMNLCINARDAMPGGGILRVTAKNEEIDESYASMIPGAKPGCYVVLEVSDTGQGMPAEILDQIFDPFFTTKAAGKGTGLGLATVVGIVKNHDGFLSVKSQVGQGTTFKVFLPAAAATEPAGEAPKRAVAPSGHGELILVVDDEASVRAMAKVVLETNGYRVLQACEGTEGIALYAKNADKIALTLTDIAMPFLDGIGLIRAIRRMNPEAKIIASTGHAEEKQLAELKSMNLSALMNKPFGAQTLLVTLADALCFSATSTPL